MLGVNEKEEALIKQMESISVAINKSMEETIAEIHTLLKVMESDNDYTLTPIRMDFLSQHAMKYGELPKLILITDPETKNPVKVMIKIKGEGQDLTPMTAVVSANQLNAVCREYNMIFHGDGSAPPQGVMVKRSQIVHRPDLAEVTQNKFAVPVTPPLRRSTPSLRRGQPCPCGSGKKYKACCRGV